MIPEKEREALMRLTMCARGECPMCKYEEQCDNWDFRMELATKNMNILAEALRKLNNSEKPNNCDTCRNKGFEGCEQPCLGCNGCDLYEPKDEPTISKMEQVDEPKTQMKTQNSNLTFEKDECAKEYEELGLKELKELIEADRKDEPQTDCAWK